MELKKRRNLFIAIATIACVAIFLEVYLRMAWGFCNAPLYRASDRYEYMALPNQDGIRFGRHYHFNSYSQRSEEPDTTRRIVLGLGDSVINGGVMTDQDSLATVIFAKWGGADA